MSFPGLIDHLLLVLINTALHVSQIIYPSHIEGYFGFFQGLEIMNKATMNISVQVFV